jgi:hypothetical protein
MQEDFRIIGTRALAYLVAFAIVLAYQLEARDDRGPLTIVAGLAGLVKGRF